MEQEAVTKGQNALEAFIAKCDPAVGAGKLLVRLGFVVDETLAMVDNFAYDLVILGETGESGVRGRKLGSNTETLLANAASPVLAVPITTDFRKPEEIVFCTRILSPHKLELAWTVALAKGFGAKITLLDIEPQDTRLTAEEVQKATAALRAQLGYDQLEAHILKSASVAEAIFEYADKFVPDLLCMVMRERGFLSRILQSSLTQRVGLSSRVPFLALHEGKQD
jgi:nucleotide-binding universal stress UspA family protein